MATSTETREGWLVGWLVGWNYTMFRLHLSRTYLVAGQLAPWWASVLLWFRSTLTEEGAFEYLQSFIPFVYFNQSKVSE